MLIIVVEIRIFILNLNEGKDIKQILFNTEYTRKFSILINKIALFKKIINAFVRVHRHIL